MPSSNLEEHLRFFPPDFIPDDSYAILGERLTGDLCKIEVLGTIEKEFRLKIPEDFISAHPTMLDLVRFIVENRGAADRPD